MSEEQCNDHKKRIEPAYTAIREIKEKIESYREPRYHIIRVASGVKFDTVVERFKKIFGEDDFYHAPCHSEAKDNDVQSLIKDTPTKHTLIYIKEHLRCAVTLVPKANIGILYERVPVSVNDDVMIQGLSGRATGYDVPDDMLVYTNLESLERYLTVWDSGFTNLGDFTYQGMRTKKSKATFVHPDGFANSGVEIEEPESDYDDCWELLQEESANLVLINKFLKENGCRQKKKFKTDPDTNFIMSSTTKKLSVMLYSDVKREMESWLNTSCFDVKGNDGPFSRIFVAYKDTSDIDSVVYIARVIKKREATESSGAAAEAE